ncbi:MAG: hypothetical protein WAN49_18115, partial [Pseudolabrys sp.]
MRAPVYHSGRHESDDPTNYHSVSEASAAYCQHRSENRARKGPSPRISRRKIAFDKTGDKLLTGWIVVAIQRERTSKLR